MSEILPLQAGADEQQSTPKPKAKAPQKKDQVFLDKNGKPCRACTAFRDFTIDAKASTSSKDTNAMAAMMGAAAGTSQTKKIQGPPPDCPADVETLGRHTWTFLHTMAAYYPEKPTTVDRFTTRLFLATFSQLYPCWHCADHLQQYTRTNPPKLGSQQQFSRWMCEAHNEVNERLGKPRFDCGTLDDRWKDGPADGRCG